MTVATTEYAFNNGHQAAREHHAALSELLDHYTIWRLSRLGSWEGARCLELGAGGGSIAGWLAEQVGPTGEQVGPTGGQAGPAGGHVVATDLDVRHIASHPNLSIVATDLREQPWRDELDGPFDLIHARLVLAHIPQRRAIFSELVRRLRPGGTLLIEDWAALRDGVVHRAPTDEAGQLYQQYQHAVTDTLEAAGLDRTWAEAANTAMRQEGLVEVATEIHAGYWPGGSPGLRIVAAGIAQLRPKLLAAGWSDPQLHRVADVVNHPDLLVRGHPLYSTSGTRPM